MATFLEAEWRKLLMVNYAVDPALLKPYLPAKTELDLWNDTCYVSLVGFMFLNTKVFGFKIPFHKEFEEVNLRFYVQYKDGAEWKRGVVFIKEIAPKRAIEVVANTVYGEHYHTLPMTHLWQEDIETLSVEYKWKLNRWHSVKVVVQKTQNDVAANKEAEFITEHYWGYTKRSESATSEYRVDHPHWSVYPTISHAVDVDFGMVYGRNFEFLTNEKPKSVFLAEGSEISVLRGRLI